MKWLTAMRMLVLLVFLVLVACVGNLVATHDQIRHSNAVESQQQAAQRKVTVTVSQLHAAEISFCRDSNRSRAQQVQLWTHLAAIATPSPHLTRAQLASSRRKVAALLAYIRHDFRPRSCSAIYRLPR